MSGVKGQRKEEREFEKYVGMAKVNVVAINPDREQLNALFGKENKEEDKPIEYLSTDNEGNDKVRMTFWLRDEKTKKLFAHNINIIDRYRRDNAETKYQYINTVLDTGWANEDNLEEELPDFFTNFLDKEKNPVGAKKYRKAKAGEEELGIFIKAWLGKLKFNHPDTEVEFDLKRLFAGDYKEIASLMLPENPTEDQKKESLTSAFVFLLGVSTDKDDKDKQYQQVFSKAFLPGNFITYINNGMNFSTEYAKNTWKNFLKKVEDPVNDGKYAFKAYYELGALKVYDKSKDVAQGGQREEEEVTEENDQY